MNSVVDPHLTSFTIVPGSPKRTPMMNDSPETPTKNDNLNISLLLLEILDDQPIKRLHVRKVASIFHARCNRKLIASENLDDLRETLKQFMHVRVDGNMLCRASDLTSFYREFEAKICDLFLRDSRIYLGEMEQKYRRRFKDSFGCSLMIVRLAYGFETDKDLLRSFERLSYVANSGEPFLELAPVIPALHRNSNTAANEADDDIDDSTCANICQLIDATEIKSIHISQLGTEYTNKFHKKISFKGLGFKKLRNYVESLRSVKIVCSVVLRAECERPFLWFENCVVASLESKSSTQAAVFVSTLYPIFRQKVPCSESMFLILEHCKSFDVIMGAIFRASDVVMRSSLTQSKESMKSWLKSSLEESATGKMPFEHMKERFCSRYRYVMGTFLDMSALSNNDFLTIIENSFAFFDLEYGCTGRKLKNACFRLRKEDVSKKVKFDLSNQEGTPTVQIAGDNATHDRIPDVGIPQDNSSLDVEEKMSCSGLMETSKITPDSEIRCLPTDTVLKMELNDSFETTYSTNKNSLDVNESMTIMPTSDETSLKLDKTIDETSLKLDETIGETSLDLNESMTTMHTVGVSSSVTANDLSIDTSVFTNDTNLARDLSSTLSTKSIGEIGEGSCDVQALQQHRYSVTGELSTPKKTGTSPEGFSDQQSVSRDKDANSSFRLDGFSNEMKTKVASVAAVILKKKRSHRKRSDLFVFCNPSILDNSDLDKMEETLHLIIQACLFDEATPFNKELFLFLSRFDKSHEEMGLRDAQIEDLFDFLVLKCCSKIS